MWLILLFKFNALRPSTHALEKGDRPPVSFSVDITPFNREFSDGWNLYFNRNDYSELYNLLKENGEVTMAVTGVIPSAIYEDSQDNLALAKQ